MKPLFLIFSFFIFITISAQNNYKYLDINQVRAGIANRGDMHYDFNLEKASYEVPVGSGVHSDFASALWIGGYDTGNQLHIAAQTYRQSGVDFWPGPLDTITGSITSTVSNQYDKIWKLNQSDINAFVTNFNNGNVQNGSYIPVADLLSWPAKGTGACTKNMAPFVDANNNHIYDPLVGGDYPIIKGDQSLYFIFNDNLSTHQSTGGLPLKVEIHATAYAYGNSAVAGQYPFLNKTTFYNYKIINRSNMNYHDVFVTLWSDSDIGYAGDDYIACNVSGNYGYTYNGIPFDSTFAGTAGYGANPPAAGYQVLKGPFIANDGIDNNNNGTIDEACEQQLMSRFTYFNNSFAGVPLQTADPSGSLQYYQYMTGYWRDAMPFTCGGNAYGGAVSTPFVYPGTTYSNSPCGSANWSETSIPGDRRYMISVGPFDFNTNSVQEIEFAHCTSFDYVNNDPVAKLKTDMQMIKAFSNVFDPPNCLVNSVKEEDEQQNVNLFPNPANAQLTISFNQRNSSFVNVTIIDVFGKVVLTKESKDFDQMNLNLSELTAGIYFAKIISNGKSQIKKFVKE